jgi:hypothetical protein
MLKHDEMFRREDLTNLSQKREFLKLPLKERRQILLKQAEEAAHYYESEEQLAEREPWQGGDIVNY